MYLPLSPLSTTWSKNHKQTKKQPCLPIEKLFSPSFSSFQQQHYWDNIRRKPTMNVTEMTEEENWEDTYIISRSHRFVYTETWQLISSHTQASQSVNQSSIIQSDSQSDRHRKEEEKDVSTPTHHNLSLATNAVTNMCPLQHKKDLGHFVAQQWVCDALDKK